jgi:hypothetical protein
VTQGDIGGTSLRKLHELGDVPQWVSWLKETFEKHEAESRAALEREIRRAADAPATAQPKWRTTVRLYSPSHSIRQKPINEFNAGLRWLKFRAVQGRSDQLLVDLDAGSNMLISDVWQSSYHMARRVVMALNVATLGYFGSTSYSIAIRRRPVASERRRRDTSPVGASSATTTFASTATSSAKSTSRRPQSFGGCSSSQRPAWAIRGSRGS